MEISKVLTPVMNFITVILPDFFKNNFEILYTKKSKTVGCIIGAIALLAVILNVKEYTSLEFSSKWFLLGFALVFPFVIGFVTAFTVRIKNDLINKIWHFVALFIMPVITITMTECLNNIFVYNMTYAGFWGNYLVVAIMYFIVFACSGSFKWSYLIINTVLFGFAVAHSYIMDFRGTPFLPMDFLSITTAVGVANTYEYRLTYKVMTALLLFIFLTVAAIKTKTPKYHILTRVISRSFMGTVAAVVLLIFYGTNIVGNMGIRPDFWNQTRGYKNYGFVLNFIGNTRYLYMSEPDDYNAENLENYVGGVIGEDGGNTVDSTKNPNIICIMNESLSDLSVLGNLTTNEDYMPFMRSLTENTIRGNLYVPVIGAGTSNSEFEFLTGHSTAFLPSGSNAYMLYIDKPIASMVSTLKAQGYSSYNMHPYYRAGWNRTEVYSNFGFDKFDAIEDLFTPEFMEQYRENSSDPDHLQIIADQMYPQGNFLVRQYVSDSYNYKTLIENFENRNKNIPYFAFNVTMQNHGGYATSSLNFNESIYATSTSKKYNKLDKYLSLVKYSDDAFKGLIEYFSTVKEPTVICMFGDHQPSVENAAIAEIMGVENLNSLTPQQEQQRHCTPFFIWANYDIEERTIDKLSSNYLSSLVLETAGVKLTEYNKYLMTLSKTLPVIDSVGYIDNQNNYYKWSDSSPYTGILDEYEKVQYNNIFDQQNVKSSIYYLDGYVHSATPVEPKEATEEAK